MSDKIKPHFNKKLPKNAKHYFDPASDIKFKAKHPARYKVLIFCGLTALFLPMILFLIFIIGIYPAPNSGWLMLGFAGAFIIGVGLFNIVAAWIGQYLGHLVTGLCIGIGAFMVGASVLLLYNKTLYDLFDQEMVSYYFANLLFLCLPALYYAGFRYSVHRWLRKRIGKTEVNKYKKGKRNFWWYEKINEKYNIGFLYHINRLFTIIFPISFAMHLLLGWIKILSIPVVVLLGLSCIMASVMSAFSSIQYNKEIHGKPFVIIARSPNQGIDSFIFDLGIAAFPLGIAYTELIGIASLWHLPWHLTIG